MRAGQCGLEWGDDTNTRVVAEPNETVSAISALLR